jgi:4-cresol dehydrogenase (hydroxylating)
VDRGANFRAAIAAWTDELGGQRVDVRAESLARVNRATFATSTTTAAILLPSDTTQIAACLRIANRFRIPLHPIAAGRNWGYGSAVPHRDGSVVMSLAGLDRITDYDEALGQISLQPGVTFAALAEFLRNRASPFAAPMTGSSPHASVVGNVLERGMGKAAYQDMAGRLVSLVAMLGSGDTIRTQADAAGPELIGLFPQSNLAVVTEITFALAPTPRASRFLSWPLRDHKTLAALLDLMRPQLQRERDRLHVEVLNDYRFYAQTAQFPYHAFDGTQPLPRTWLEAHMDVPAQWIAGVTLGGASAEELALCADALVRTLEGIGAPLAGVVPVRDPAAMPPFAGLRCAYWRKHRPMPADPDPDRDRCGVIWIAPEMPMIGDRVVEAVREIEGAMLASGFEPAISLRLLDGRRVRAIVAILFDREVAGVDAAALRCQDAVREILDRRGLGCYRHGLLDAPPAQDAGTRRLLAALKAAADPHSILAPGRYSDT